MKHRLSTLLHHEATAWGVLIVSILMTILAWFVSNEFLERDAEEQFNGVVRIAEHSILERMTAYQEVLRAGAGFVDNSEQVSRREWHGFVETLQLGKMYPGIQGLGFTVLVAPADKARFEQAVRAEGFPDFVIRPDGQRDRYSAIIYLEPFDWRNRRAFGYDMLSEPVRRAAMEHARDTGDIAMSGRVTLVQEAGKDVQAGTLMYLPIYRQGMPRETMAERRAALTAYVYSPFRIGDLMRGILGPETRSLMFELYDGAEMRDEALIFRSDAMSGWLNVSSGATAPQPRFSRIVSLQIAGRTWTARFVSSRDFERDVASIQPSLIAAGGILADMLLFATLFSISRGSRLLAVEKKRFESAVESAAVAMAMVDDGGAIVLVNSSFEQLFGYQRNELLGRRIEALLPAEFHRWHEDERRKFGARPATRAMAEGRELYGVRKDGSRLAVEIGLSSLATDTGRYVVATVSDITERKRHLEALQEREQRYRSAVETTSEGFWATDNDGRLITVNDAYCRMSGYSREELLTLSVTDLEASETPDETAAHIAKLRRDGADQFETVHRRKDGSLWPVEVTVSAVPSVGEMFAYFRDLTELKKLEAERAAATEQIRQLAFVDPLTQLPNRRLLADRLQQAMAAAGRSRRHCALLFIDLDNFKQLNDTLGHETGDLLLVAAAERLRLAVREEDTVARLGGDEFVVMLVGLDEDDQPSLAKTRLVGEKILEALNQPYRLNAHVHRSTASIGATLFRDDKEVDAILRRADHAMYEAKKSGRAGLRFFDAGTELGLL